MANTKVYLTRRPTKLPSGKKVSYWTLKFFDKQGKTRWKSVGRVGRVTRAEAVAAQRALIVALGNGKVRQDKPCRMTLSQFVEFHEAQFGHGNRPTTLIEWRISGGHAVKALGDKALEDITWADIAEIRGHMDRLGRSEATIGKTLRMLRAMLGRAAKRGMILENPFAGERLGERVTRPKRIFGQAEIDAMLDAAPSLTWEALIQLAITSGLRKSELLHLRWADIDLDVGTVRVEEHHAGRYAVSGRDVPILAWQPKTKRSSRTVPIPPATVDLLHRLRMTSGGSPYLFVDIDRLAVIDARAKVGTLRPNFDLVNNFTRQFDEIQVAAKRQLTAANWPHGCFHDLRKTFATRAAGSGVPMHELQAHLGHSSITTTAEYYTAIEDSAADRLRKVFERVA